MTHIVETDEHGTLHLSADVLGEVKPHARYIVERQAGTLILRVEQRQPFWATATPEERAARFLKWAQSHAEGPGLPDEALRREQMYE